MKYSASDKYAHSAIISLDNQVFGGPQAVEFSALLAKAVESGITKVVVDCSEVEMMNSSGLGMLVGGLTSMRKSGGTFCLASVPARVMHLLDITKLHSVLKVYITIEEAFGESIGE